jgi:hypothetical protein
VFMAIMFVLNFLYLDYLCLFDCCWLLLDDNWQH